MHRLLVTRPLDVERFCAFLRSVHVRVHEVDGATVLASLPGAPTPMHERREMSGYVTTWNALHPSSPVEIALPDDTAA